VFHSFGDLCLLSLADEHSTESLTKTDLVRCPGMEASFTNRGSEVAWYVLDRNDSSLDRLEVDMSDARRLVRRRLESV